ncbi:MAG TPA: fructosamine kinase family protein [Polyangiaceae bacterium]|jgi:fructosamine-3-kinase|nr:fructosamine kinase family protein [Polyangiaceae bacterium]
MKAALRSALEAALGASITGASPISGGDINDAHGVTLADGRRYFVKSNDQADSRMFPAEARGLAWLADARALRVPAVVAVSQEGAEEPYLVLELLESRPRVRDFDERFGRGLAALHRSGAPRFGLEYDNFIGRLPQSNRAHPTWAEFYRDERLLPQLEMARRARRATARMERGFETLFARLPELVGPEEPPSRVHGDLWGGNLHVDDVGGPCLIDPAPHGGHRELDLAMMCLFGGFSSRVFDAYAEAFPLSPGEPERVALYQLYFLMVHVNLFGGSYGASAESALASYG